MSGADSPDQGSRTSSVGYNQVSYRKSRHQEIIRCREEAHAIWQEPILNRSASSVFCEEYLRKHGTNSLQAWEGIFTNRLRFVKENGGAYQDRTDQWNALTPSEQAPYRAKIAQDVAEYTADLDAYNKRIPLSPSVHSSDGYDSGLSDEGEDGFYDRYFEGCRRRAVQRWNRYRQDHPRACGGALLPVPAQPFRFLDLALELRGEIYTMVLEREKALTQMNADGSTDDEDGPVDVRIFSVCRQVFAEAVDVFYKINILRVTVSHDDDLPLFISASTGRKAPRPTTRLRRVDLYLNYFPPETKRWTESVLRSVCEVLSKCERLIEIRITANSQQSRVDSMHRDFDRMLELMSVIKGVGGVTFMYRECQWMGHGILEHLPLGTPEQVARIKRIRESRPTRTDFGIMEGQS